MAKITVTDTFLEGTERFVAGKEYDVDPALAAYAVRNGWATGSGRAAAQPQDVTLDIQSSSHKSSAKNAQ